MYIVVIFDYGILFIQTSNNYMKVFDMSNKIYLFLDEKSGKFLKVLDEEGLHLTDNIYEAMQFKTSYEKIKKDCDDFNITCEDYRQSKFYKIKGEYLFKPVLIEFLYKEIE